LTENANMLLLHFTLRERHNKIKSNWLTLTSHSQWPTVNKIIVNYEHCK